MLGPTRVCPGSIADDIVHWQVFVAAEEDGLGRISCPELLEYPNALKIFRRCKVQDGFPVLVERPVVEIRSEELWEVLFQLEHRVFVMDAKRQSSDCDEGGLHTSHHTGGAVLRSAPSPKTSNPPKTVISTSTK